MAVPLWIARHQGVATAGLSSGRTDGILEVASALRPTAAIAMLRCSRR